MSATYIPYQSSSKLTGDAILIAGGCDDENGNVFFTEEWGSYFACNSVSDKLYAFYPSTHSLVELTPLPSERHRHAATYLDGKLYLIGGRKEDDSINTDIDVYNPKTDTWTTLMQLPEQYQYSDNAAVTYDGKIYVVGGWSGDYSAVSDLIYSLDVSTKTITPKTQMSTARGDLSAVLYPYTSGDFAVYAIGGFGSDFATTCSPLSTVERYDFNNDQWSTVAPLKNPRGDMAAVNIGHRILTMAGESKDKENCSNADQSVAVDDVETYHPEDAEPTWEVEADFSNYRFRAAAAVFPKTGTVYFFGGQANYDPTCNCHKTVDDILAFRDEDGVGDGDNAGYNVRDVHVNTVLMTLMTALVAWVTIM